MKLVLGLFMLACAASVSAQESPVAQTQPPSILRELRVEGATVFTRDDVLWMLQLREGAPLPGSPSEVAKAFEERYGRDGYTEARVTATFEAGLLTLSVAEGRIDEIEIAGLSPKSAESVRRRLAIKPGDIYNKRTVGQAVRRLERESQGALSIDDDVKLERRNERGVLVVPFRTDIVRPSLSFASGREDLFSPVDGFTPSFSYSTTIFDTSAFNHTFFNVYASYKFSSERGGFSIGGERPVFSGPRVFIGAEAHDLTASDDLWRISPMEQTVASGGFKNTFRDYYRRVGGQAFGVFRAGNNNEFSASVRWDRHRPIANETDFSIFRDDATYRPNPLIEDQQVNAIVVGYTFDTRPLTGAGRSGTYLRHLKDDLFGHTLRQRPGLRLDWTSEIAGHAMKGDAEFDRHILNARGYLPIGPRSLVAMRGIFGFSNGTLPIERQFAIGGIGTVHGYAFKESGPGTGLTLFNAEYRLNLGGSGHGDASPFGIFVFYDAGRVSSPFADPAKPWLTGTGFGISLGGSRIEFGYRTSAIPSSLQILLRLTPTF